MTSTPSTIPAGAAALASPTQTTGTYSYTVTVAGTYGYGCTIHAGMGMVGSFTASAVGIAAPSVDLTTAVYPNPFADRVTVRAKNIESVKFFNVIGEIVKEVAMTSADSKVEVDFQDMPSGIYFVRTYANGNIVETRKIVKSK